MNWSESNIIRAISLQVFSKRCMLLVDNCNWTGHECDVLGVTDDLRIIDVEVKISRADLKADAKKDKWWYRLTWKEAEDRGVDYFKYREPLQHPPKVWKHYYAMPEEIWKPELLECLPSTASGVLLLKQVGSGSRIDVRCERRATPARDASRLTPESVMHIARLANIRMWEARAALDAGRAAA